MTKPLTRITFERLRDKMMGWKPTPEGQFPFKNNPIYVAVFFRTFSALSHVAIDGVDSTVHTPDTR